MFTGLIEEVGRVERLERRGAGAELRFQASRIREGLQLGESVAVQGICLTITSIGSWTLAADVSGETLERTNLSRLTPGALLNLERALTLQSRLGGHLVTGHIDGLATITRLQGHEGFWDLECTAPPELMRYIAEKGSVALDGISLTIAGRSPDHFSVAVIPTTITQTNLTEKKAGDQLNLECDLLAKYVETLLAAQSPTATNSITMEFLNQHGIF